MESKKCPKCGRPLIFSQGAFRCQNRRCLYVETVQKEVEIPTPAPEPEETPSIPSDSEIDEMFAADESLSDILGGLGENTKKVTADNIGGEHDYHVSGYRKVFKYGRDEEKYLECLLDSEYTEDIFDLSGSLNQDVLRALNVIYSNKNDRNGYDSLMRTMSDVRTSDGISRELKIISMVRAAALGSIRLSDGIKLKTRKDILTAMLKNDDDSKELMTKHFNSALFMLGIRGQDSSELANQIFTYLDKTVAYVDISSPMLSKNTVVSFGTIDYFTEHLFDSPDSFGRKIACINHIGFSDTYENVSAKTVRDRRIYDDLGYSQEYLPSFLKLAAFYTTKKEIIPFRSGLSMPSGLTRLVNLSALAKDCLYENYQGNKSRFMRAFQFLIASGCFDAAENKYHALSVSEPTESSTTLKELAKSLSFEDFVDRLKNYYVPVRQRADSVKFMFGGRFINVSEMTDTLEFLSAAECASMIKDSLKDTKNGVLSFLKNYGVDDEIFTKIIRK